MTEKNAHRNYVQLALCACILLSAVGGFGIVTCKTQQCVDNWKTAAANSLAAATVFGTYLANPPEKD